jgi:hypothetical protein
MKGKSKLLLLFIFVITVALGAVAIWVGLRLGEEEEIMPEEGKAAGETHWCSRSGDDEFQGHVDICLSDTKLRSGDTGLCQDSFDQYYATKSSRPTCSRHLACTTQQVDFDKWGNSRYRVFVYGPNPNSQYCRRFISNEEYSDKCQDGPGNQGCCGKNNEIPKTWDWTECTVCESSTGAWDFNGDSLTLTISAASVVDKDAMVHIGDSIPEIPVRVHISELDEGGNVLRSQTEDVSVSCDIRYEAPHFWRNDSCCTPDPWGWSSERHATARNNFNAGPGAGVENGGVECTISSQSFDFTRNQNGTGVSYQYVLEVQGNSPHGSAAWKTSNACQGTEDAPPVESEVACSSLSANPESVTNEGGTVTLTTTASATNTTISNYDYDADIGASSLTDGNTTTTWTIPSGTSAGTYHAWVLVSGADGSTSGCSAYDDCTTGGTGCRVELEVTELPESMNCESLTSDTEIAITEDDIRVGEYTADLTTAVETENVDVTGYEYGVPVEDEQYITVDPDDQNPENATLTVAQNTPNGTYSVWVNVTGTGTSSGGTYTSGCEGDTSDDCDPGATECLLTFSVGPGTCDCETVTRSPSDDDLAPGSYVAYTLTAADQNGNACNVDATDVTWTTEGDPDLVEIERDPTSGESAQHYIIYQVPESATADTTYTVSARVGDDQIAACVNTLSIGDVELPAFAAIKTSSITCINNNTAAQITYTIHVRNISDVVGVIEYVEDTYDSQFQSSWISNITPTPDSHSGNVIRWDNNDAGYTLAANDGSSGGDDEIEFSYVVTVPSAYFGTDDPIEYRNHAIVSPQDQDDITLETVSEITCVPAPETGLFDNAIRNILIALLFIIIGGISLRIRDYTYKYFVPIESSVRNPLKALLERRKLTKKERFEKRVVKEIEKKSRQSSK